ncbi:CBS domain-containing protein [Sporohalobacter salinus]|uniref:CBS domain-containing protein n=1 Tax=Sporohalobacter salinus TaxID=1494606 RepID=UPI00195F6882|nr:CBS domain-containing protein [Sporohalobacter salinus]MBM7624037.1 CBS domain-containing protein [Sporohalobacter salinus]
METKEIMTKNVVTIHQDKTIKDVAEVLSEHKFSGLPVVNDEDEIVGVITERDLIARNKKLHFPNYIQVLDSIIYLESLSEFEDEFRKMIGAKVKDVMTKEVISVDIDTTVDKIVEIMVDNNINRVPVISNDKLVGVVSRADIVKILAQ